MLQDAYFSPYRQVQKCGTARRVSASGYIEERLKTLRCKLTPTKKPHKKHVFRRLSVNCDDPQCEDGKCQHT